ncbi:MAG TPA: type II toxin-antitoxin system RelE/ParE family toxin [Phycisphaerae bacterium]|nr:type II toxin-antitoxin system RelE/ParE family toxin [Phycisphaerae bacterium]
MELKTDSNGRYVVNYGTYGSILCAVRRNGNSPAKKFLESLDESMLRRFYVLFKKMVSCGQITNRKQFKKVQDDIWEFKRFQHRIGCFREGPDLVLTHGFVKKDKKWRREEIEKAQQIMRVDKDRIV